MTRKDLETKYNFYGQNDNIYLYRKNGDYDYGLGYCGNISLKNGKAIFHGKSYSTIEDLDKALREWEKTLPYPVGTYNPMMNETARVEQRLTWYLTEKLGFKGESREWEYGYVKYIGPSFKINFQFKREEDSVVIMNRLGGIMFSQEVKDAETGIEYFNSIVNSTVLMMAKDMIDALSVCDTKISTEVETYVPTNENIFGMKRVDFKEFMISHLEPILKQLKGE